MSFAVLDIGSNGARSLWGNHQGSESRRFKIRLGEDAFSKGHLGSELISRLTQIAFDFHSLIDEKGVSIYRAVGTSALRNSVNGPEVIRAILKKTGIQIDCISSEEEARLVHLAVRSALPQLKNQRGLILDIGGGSAEFIEARRGGQIGQIEPFGLGTVRLLERFGNLSRRVRKEKLNHFLERELEGSRLIGSSEKKPFEFFVATGGNPRCLGRLGKNLDFESSENQMSRDSLRSLSTLLWSMSYKERIQKLGLKRDRADVILPAMSLVDLTCDLLKQDHVLFPNVGLKEGLLWDLIEKGR